jgi:hypothetical protein
MVIISEAQTDGIWLNVLSLCSVHLEKTLS